MNLLAGMSTGETARREEQMAKRATSTLLKRKILRKARSGKQTVVRKCTPCSCTAYTAKKSNRVCRLCQADERTGQHDRTVRSVLAGLSESKLPSIVCVLEVSLYSPDSNREEGKYASKQPFFRADIVVVCEEWVCVIEVDGAEHRYKQQRQSADERKEKLLSDLDVPVVRLPISNDENEVSRKRVVEQAVQEVCNAYWASH